VLVTVYADTVAQVLGTLSPAMKQKLDECLKVALGLPELRNAGSKMLKLTRAAITVSRGSMSLQTALAACLCR
jgi:hypothetical protein